MAKSLFNFEAEFKLGIELMDNEHLRLVEMLNQVYNLLADGQKAEACQYFRQMLSSYVHAHFAHEERFMEIVGFPQIEDHKKIHENFKKSFLASMPLLESYDDATFRKALTDTFTWIINHIGKTDRKYAAYYLAKNPAAQ